MSFHNNKFFRLAGAEPHVKGLWQILLPALLYTVLYNVFQYACLLEFRHLRASGPPFLRSFTSNRPGICMALMMVVPMAAALLAVLWEGILRLRAFRRETAESRDRRKSRTLVPLLLAAAAAALCVFGNAQIQAMDLHSESVDTMQPIYRELPFFLIFLIFALVTPFAEEFVFRGLVYTGLRSRYPALPSVIAAAVLFGLYHGELLQGAYAACMGLLLGYSMEMTGDLRVPWLLHGIANGLPLCLTYFGVWETFLRAGWRVGALACFLALLGVLRFLPARQKSAGSSMD